MNLSRTTARAAVVAAAVTGVLTLASPAFAHVEVESDGARALATDVTIAFSAEAESTTAGVTALRVVLPEGIAPADVTLTEAPDGWTLAVTDDGYTVSGPAVAPGKDVAYKITVRQLPDAGELAFKTLQSYSDGRIDRWIELPKNGTEPEKPAPVLALKAAAPGATPIAPSPSATATAPGPTTSAAPTASTTAAAPAEASSPTAVAAAQAVSESGGDGSSAVPIAVAAVAVLAVAGGAAWWWRRRRTTGA
ncbi:DUF1775 domain-containing protein [Kitasatospora hibisci]|uniref:DUF1775 domain-containing protein n=1 Tax=Kitasatospora hibisci TaxID=3369522 RepID=UPI003754DA22